MELLDSILISIFGMAVVFAVLVCLIALIKIQSFIFSLKREPAFKPVGSYKGASHLYRVKVNKNDFSVEVIDKE